MSGAGESRITACLVSAWPTFYWSFSTAMQYYMFPNNPQQMPHKLDSEPALHRNYSSQTFLFYYKIVINVNV